MKTCKRHKWKRVKGVHALKWVTTFYICECGTGKAVRKLRKPWKRGERRYSKKSQKRGNVK